MKANILIKYIITYKQGNEVDGTVIREISGSHGGEYENDSLLGYSAV
jgi:hypothetical protein